MTYLLDTNVIIDLANAKYPSTKDRFESLDPRKISISSITQAELEYGEAKSGQPSRTLAPLTRMLARIEVRPFDGEGSKVYGRLRADLERKGLVIGANDMLTASTALVYDLTLVTRDVSELKRIQGLQVEDWSVG